MTDTVTKEIASTIRIKSANEERIAMPRIIHFEISADKPEEVSEFYKNVFGWKIEKWGDQDYWLVTTGPENEPGVNGAITQRIEARTTVNTVEVSDINEFLSRVTSSGGSVLAPSSEIPGVGTFAYCADPEGNVFGILQPSMAAPTASDTER